MSHERPQALLEAEPFQFWTAADGHSCWCEFRKVPGEAGFNLRFPGLADFEIRDQGCTVAAFPVPGLDPDTVEHLYLNQVLPLALNLQGVAVFHGSAVGLGDAGATAFLGASGRGKSTLATFLATHGATLFSDDGLVIEPSANGVLLHPSHPSLRLWQDSLVVLGRNAAASGRTTRYNSKRRITAEDGHIRMAQHASVLRRAYFLGDGSANAIQIRPIHGHAAALRWIEHAFVLDIRDPATMKANLAHAAWLANLGITYELDYPREYAFLPAVRAALLDADSASP